MKAKREYVRLHVKTDRQSESDGLRSTITTKKERPRRALPAAGTDKEQRVLSPLEAEQKNSKLYSKLGVVSTTTRHQAQRRRHLKARRNLTLKPAPVPVTAPKNGAGRVIRQAWDAAIAHLKKLDLPLFLVVLLLGVIGILAVHSATRSMRSARYDFMQIVSFIIGMGLLIVLPAFDYGDLLKRRKWILIANVALLLVTAIFGVSVTGDTNRNWIDLGFTRIQPAEFSKILFILSLAAHLDKVRERLNRPKTLLFVLLHGALIIGLVLLERDFGNALVFFVIFAVMLFAAKIDLRYILAAFIAAVGVSPLVWDKLDDFRQKRILTGFDPDLDPLGAGHQVIRSRNAIASGGIFGQGYMQGVISQHRTALFAKHTDMIFAVIGEETGFVGCFAVVALFILLVFRVIVGAMRARDYAGTYICAGVAGMLTFHFIVNIGMCLGLTPVVGITLPLVSYGASSLLSIYLSLALVMSVFAGADTYSYRRV